MRVDVVLQFPALYALISAHLQLLPDPFSHFGEGAPPRLVVFI